jgi:hypothetical protein
MRKGWLLTKTCGLAALLLLAGAFVLLLPSSAGATVISATKVDFLAFEGSAFNGAVATFTDDNPSAVPSDFTATIDWGDATTTAGTIAGSGIFTVTGQHTYADEGSFTATVTVSDVSPGPGTDTATDTATVSENDTLIGAPVSFVALAGVPFTTTVATFTDSNTVNVTSDFTAIIQWGDATATAGTVSGGSGSFSVSGSHTYAGTGVFTVTVTLTDDAPGVSMGIAASTATVAGAGLNAFPVSFAAAEGMAFNGVVANFTDSRAGASVGDFTATIDWGDATTTAGTVASTNAGVFSVSGAHTYSDEGSFSVTVHVTDTVSTTTAAATGTATVAEGDALTAHAVAFPAAVSVPFTGTVATFTDSNTLNAPADFTAIIDWGDTTTTAGTVTGGGASFTVSGSHTYAGTGTFTVSVTLADDAPGTASATATSTANVAAALGNLSVEKTLLSPSPVHRGVPFTYQIVVTNLAGDATNVHMMDNLDMKVGFDSMTAPTGWVCVTPPVGQFGNVDCTNPSFTAGSSATFTLTVTFLPSEPAVSTENTATVSQDLVDSAPTDNTSTVTTPVVAAASVPVSAPALVLLGVLVAGAGILIRR